jgi:hypothetical protein
VIVKPGTSYPRAARLEHCWNTSCATGSSPLWGSLWESPAPKRANFGGLGRMTTGDEKEPKAHIVRDFRLSYEVGGTGLEPVAPSLSIRSGRSRRFADVRSGRMVERIRPADELPSERERMSSVAIVATLLPTFRLVLAHRRPRRRVSPCGLPQTPANRDNPQPASGRHAAERSPSHAVTSLRPGRAHWRTRANVPANRDPKRGA